MHLVEIARHIWTFGSNSLSFLHTSNLFSLSILEWTTKQCKRNISNEFKAKLYFFILTNGWLWDILILWIRCARSHHPPLLLIVGQSRARRWCLFLTKKSTMIIFWDMQWKTWKWCQLVNQNMHHITSNTWRCRQHVKCRYFKQFQNFKTHVSTQYNNISSVADSVIVAQYPPPPLLWTQVCTTHNASVHWT